MIVEDDYEESFILAVLVNINRQRNCQLLISFQIYRDVLIYFPSWQIRICKEELIEEKMGIIQEMRFRKSSVECITAVKTLSPSQCPRWVIGPWMAPVSPSGNIQSSIVTEYWWVLKLDFNILAQKSFISLTNCNSSYYIYLYFQTLEKESNGRKKPRKPFLYRVWRFLQTTATEVIKGDSKYKYILSRWSNNL